MDNNKAGWKWGRQAGRTGVVGWGGGKGRELYLNNYKKIFFNVNVSLALQYEQFNFKMCWDLRSPGLMAKRDHHSTESCSKVTW